MSSGILEILIIGLVLAGSAAATFWRRFSVGRLVGDMAPPADDSPDSSAIISYYSAGHLFTAATRNKLNNMDYSTYVTMPTGNATFTDAIAAIVALDLPFNTEAHLVGLSKEHKIDRLQFASFLQANGMEKVTLEGDFPDYFDIYAAPGQEMQVREVLNPESMQFVVDFCRSHFWEINCAELYIVATESDHDNQSIIAQSQEFVSRIKPALLPGDTGAAPVHHQAPYGEYDGPALSCPICRKVMTVQENWQLCPEGHGVLLSGRDIIGLRHHQLEIPADPTKAVKHGQLTCPNCHYQMQSVNYEDSGVEIDSCENCPFRWLDANEVGALGSKI